MTRARRVLVLGALALVAIAIAVVVFRPSPLPVESAAATRGPLRETITEEGDTRVRDRFVLAAPITGRVGRIALMEGDTVQPGQVVAMLTPGALDPRAREQALARLRAAEDARSEAEARIAQAREQLGEAQRELARARQLAANAQIAARDLDRAEVAERARAAELDAATFRAKQAAHDVENARAVLDEPGAGRARAMPLRAPAGGRVLRVYERDERVVAAGSPVMEIGDPEHLELVIPILSSDAARVRPGARVLVEQSGDTGTVTARVRRVEPSAFTKVSALGIEEQRVNVIADIDSAPPTLGDRFRVEAHIVVWEGQDVLRVPTGALFRAGNEWHVFIVAGGRARERTIQVGHRGGTAVEILSGLTQGEHVIVHPGERITDGARVSPTATRDTNLLAATSPRPRAPGAFAPSRPPRSDAPVRFRSARVQEPGPWPPRHSSPAHRPHIR